MRALDRPLSVLHVCCTASFAGVERHVSELASAQATLGDHVVVVGGDQSRMRLAVAAAVDVLPGHRIDVALRSFRQLHSRPDVVNVHMTAAEVAVALSPDLRGIPVVSTRHFASQRGARRVTRPIVRFGTSRVDAEVAVSQYVADQVEGPSTVVLSGVRAEADGVAANDRGRVVLVAQRLEPEKRTDIAIRAFAASELVHQGWRLQIAGDGALRSSLVDLAGRLGLDGHVEFLGHRRDVHELMRSAGLFLAPRPDEAFGLSVVEAMARALPVVAAGSGAHLETVGSVTDAALFQSSSTHQAARWLCELASADQVRHDYGARLQSAQRARFTVDLQARNTDAVYRGLL